MPGFNKISVSQMLRLIGRPDAPRLVDVRLPEDIGEIPFVAPGALRAHHRDVLGLAGRLPPQGAVVLCHRGKKLSEGCAALLRAAGHKAQVLEGGMEAWAHAAAPATPVAILDGLGGPSVWVTRHRPKVDRVACPWLIRRFVDPDAVFLFVEPSEVAAVADRFGAIPFDTPDAKEWSHDGDRCTFDTMVSRFGLSHPALDRLALVIRAADTDRHDLSPQAAGVLAVAVGFSRLHKSDAAQLEASMPVYDALYAWARDGFGEGHDWPGGAA